MSEDHPPDQCRTIEAMPTIQPVRMNSGRPFLEANPNNPWESRVVLNAAAVLIPMGVELNNLFDTWDLGDEARTRLRESGGACILLYRAQGVRDVQKGVSPSYLGMAILTPELELVVRFPRPVIEPNEPFHNLGVEDARCIKVGDQYFLYYTGYACNRPLDPDAERRVRICLATTRDFLKWNLHGPLDGDINDIDNKNPGLFPSTVDGQWLLLHRPMSGEDAMTIHLAAADSPFGPFAGRGKFLNSYPYREFARSWIGGGAPPVKTDDGRYVVVYHQGHYLTDGTREYDLAVALVDFSKGQPIVARIEPLMRPSETERVGDSELGVDNVIFTCAAYRWRDDLVIPYAGADSRMFGASISFDALVFALERNASSGESNIE